MAARYSRRDEIRTYATEAIRAGLEVTSTWLQENHPLGVQLGDVTYLEKRDIAQRDMADIEQAEALVFFAEDAGKQPPRGGRHVEFGIAVAQGKEIFVVGAQENVFHYLPGVYHFASWGEALARIPKRS
ncbi:MAG: hypothetical protein C5B44_05730 [Acidobacteria bacterium]|nr:MAG: hypothetical protein C5B44_05730 [Acidobacteriota bacterium]